MKSPQMRAGIVPPLTAPIVKNGFIETSPAGSPIQTAVVSCGENPTNQASMFLSVVPVFPAIGRGKLPSVLLAVPERTGPNNICVSVRAMFTGITCVGE